MPRVFFYSFIQTVLNSESFRDTTVSLHRLHRSRDPATKKTPAGTREEQSRGLFVALPQRCPDMSRHVALARESKQKNTLYVTECV